MFPSDERPTDSSLSVGTQVVSLKDVQSPHGSIVHFAGAVGVIVSLPSDPQRDFHVRFLDGFETRLPAHQLMPLSEWQLGGMKTTGDSASTHGLFSRTIYRCIVGSRAFGLDNQSSDVDRRGIYLPPADLQWSLFGVPEQLENNANEECYWELKKFLIMALKGNPNILECLYTPLVEFATPLAEELLALRDAFLSRVVYQTYNGYVLSQFKRMQVDLRNHGNFKPKQVMHLIRLLLSGITILKEHRVEFDFGQHRESLLAIKRGEMAWQEVDAWRKRLHQEFDQAVQVTALPERPDYERVNAFLIRARRLAQQDTLP